MKNLPLAIILGLSLFFSGCPAPFEYWRMQVSGEEGYLRLTKITSREDLVDTESHIALSKDGSKIAFISWKSGNGDIYVRPLGTGSRALIQRTFSSERESDPAFSPDGKQIVFDVYKEGSRKICLIQAEGGSAVRIITTSTPQNADSPCFSPDGNLIACNSYNVIWNPNAGKWEVEENSRFIWTYDLNTGSMTQYVQGLMPKFTPDGKNIVFKRLSQKGLYGLWMLNFSTGSETHIIGGEDWGIGTFDIAPDGNKIVFSSNKGTYQGSNTRINSNLWIVNTDGTNLMQMTFHPGDDICPVWSPDGKYIYFLGCRGEEKEGIMNIWQMEVGK
uniref:DUF5050 domain-containing protein n=1 Tax=candidate division WOR-3 bacterium TaxID=2052148 RepID=A0A7C6AFS8_UNCW3